MRLIDADKVSTNISWMTNINALMKIELDKQPTVDAEPVVHAHWEPLHHLDDCQKYYCRCSKCGRTVGRYHGTDIGTDCPYCHCGAKMDEEAEN